MGLSFLVAKIHSACQMESTGTLCVHKSPPQVSTLNHMNQAHTFPTYIPNVGSDFAYNAIDDITEH